MPKVGGRSKGSPNKPKPIILEPTEENRALAAMAPTAKVRTPKAVMLAAMLRFERMSEVLMSKAERMTRAKEAPSDIAKVVADAHKFTIAAVQCAEKVAPYIHARLLAIESRGDNVDQRAPFVVRVPAVIADSAAWQAATGAGLADLEGLPHPAMPSVSPVFSGPPEVLPELDYGHGTAQLPPPPPPLMPKPPNYMPLGPATVAPSGSQEWLDSVAKRRAG